MLDAADGATLAPMPSVTGAIDALRAGQVDGALVPLENSVEGAVPATLDELASGSPLVIAEETYLPVDLRAARARRTPRWRRCAPSPPIRTPKPRHDAGCWRTCPTRGRRWSPPRQPVQQAVASGEYDAAIGAAVAGELYELSAIAHDIGDHPGAVTRFVLLTRPAPPPPPTGNDRTTLVAYLREDHSGALLEILTEFATRAVNLTRIESRPTKGRHRSVLLLHRLRGTHLRRPGRRRAGRPAPHLRRRPLPRLLSPARRHPGRRADGPGRRRLRRRRRVAAAGPRDRPELSGDRVQIRSAGQPTLHKIDGSEVQAGVGVVALGGDRVQVALAQQQEGVAGDLDLDAGRPG